MSSPLRRVMMLAVLSSLWLFPALAAAAYQVADGAVARNKSLLTAGSEGAVLRFASGLVINLEPATQLRLHKDVDLWMDASGKSVTEVFTLVEGRAEVNRPLVSGQRPKAVLVRTSRKLMGATRNGDMTIVAEPAQGVVASYRGEAMLSTGGSWSRMEAGRLALASRTNPQLTFQELPKAPTLKLSKRLWMSLHEPARVGGFEWSKERGDTSFKVTVAAVGRNGEGSRAVTQMTKTNELPADALALTPGEYEVRVQTANQFGLMGPYSPPQTLRVVGVRTHSGARVDARGTVHLGMNQRAEFLHVEGLLMTYGHSSSWAPATASVPLTNQQPTTIHFRLPNGSEIVSAKLEPRGVTADVFVGSKLAKWPGDAVEVMIRLRDESGAVNVETVDVKPHVTLGIEPLNVQWTRKGATLRTTIAAQPGPGPWVVRAWVVDQHGVELGRDFLEVAERSSEKLPIARQSAPRKPDVAVARVP